MQFSLIGNINLINTTSAISKQFHSTAHGKSNNLSQRLLYFVKVRFKEIQNRNFYIFPAESVS